MTFKANKSRCGFPSTVITFGLQLANLAGESFTYLAKQVLLVASMLKLPQKHFF